MPELRQIETGLQIRRKKIVGPYAVDVALEWVRPDEGIENQRDDVNAKAQRLCHNLRSLDIGRRAGCTRIHLGIREAQGNPLPQVYARLQVAGVDL